jgi:hypothetical protein
MLLYEFFGNPLVPRKHKNTEKQEIEFEKIFYYLIDHDKLHKDYFLKKARELSTQVKNKSLTMDREKWIKYFLGMVNKGCKEYFKEHKLKGALAYRFPKALRKRLAEKLLDYYISGILDGEFRLP